MDLSRPRSPALLLDEPKEKDGQTSVYTDATIESAAHVNPEIDARIRRKCTLRVLPPTFIMFMVSFWDRVNIGNAAILGLPEELDLKGSQFQIVTMILFIPFILLEIPSNIIMKKTRPYRWLSTLMVGCGICNLSMGFTHSFAALTGVRFLLGCFEAGIGAGCILVISSYFKRYELPSKLAIWYLSGIAGSALGGLLAYGIARMDGQAGLSGWRWIFIIEGTLTAFIGLVMYFFMVDWPQRATFLSAEEQSLLLIRLESDKETSAKMETWNAKRCLGDWRIWIGTLMFFCVIATTYSLNFYAPTILVEMGFGPITAQLMTFPPYACAVVCCLGSCMLSDRYKHRYGFIVFGALLGTVGYGIMLSQRMNPNLPIGAKYFALFPLICAPQIIQPLTVAWMMNNVGGSYKRAFASGCQVGLGSAGGVLASNIYFANDAPFFRAGFGVGLTLLSMSGTLATLLYFLLKRENRWRDDGKRDHLLQAPDRDNLGDDHPKFRYAC